mgnify:CR=1 FL=1
MSLIRHYSSSVENLRREIARYQQERSRASQEKARLSSSIANEQRRMNSSTSFSTLQVIAANIERCQRQSADCDRRIADADQKIARTQERLNWEEQNLFREQAREAEKMQRSHDSQINALSSSLMQTNSAVSRVQGDVEKLQKDAKRIRVLFLAANSLDTKRLQLDEEARAIQEMIRKSEYRDSIEFVTRWASRPMDLIQSINEIAPTIVHFSGHGASSGDLVLQGDDGQRRLVTSDAITAAISTAVDSVKLVVFNACFSETQARDVVRYIPAAIGMRISIGDAAARIFASQFYSAIGFGRSLDDAFRQAKAALMLENVREEQTPVLLLKDGVDPKIVNYMGMINGKEREV